MPLKHQEAGHYGSPAEVLPFLLPLEPVRVHSADANTPRPRTVLPPLSLLVYLFSVASLVVHFLGRNNYGFFRDELYYIACGNHLAFGYIDQPPLIAVVARLSSLVSGIAPAGFRILPALAGACLIVLTGLITRELGGGRFAQALAGLTVLFAPVYLAFSSFLSMNAFEPLFWGTCAFILIRILKHGDKRLWLAFGLIAGIGLQNKHTMLMFGFAVVARLILAGNSKYLRNKYVLIGGLLALLLFLPNVIWEAQHRWPQFEVVRNAQIVKEVATGPLAFVAEQVMFLNPVAFPVVAGGLLWLFCSGRGKRFRSLGLAWVIVMAVVMILHGKLYYVTPFYPILIASGAIGVGGLLARSSLLRRSYVVLLVISGLIMLPFGVPVLSLKALLRYQSLMPLDQSVKVERDSGPEFHQLYADMFGWDRMASTIGSVYHRLPAADRRRCAILAGNYGEAGAIDLLGAQYGLPRAISGHNNYHLWGTQGYTGDVVILFGQNAERTKGMFATAERVATINSPHAPPSERMLPVYVCRHSRAPLAKLWPSLRYFE